MINITINDNGSTSQEVISLGSQFENIDEVIQFTFPSDLEGLHKYVVAKTYDEKKKKNITRVTPLVDNKFVIGSAITKVTGQWLLYTLCKAYSPSGDVERVSISDPIVATVTENDFDISEIEATEIDPNIKIIYDELIDFKKTLEVNEATRQGNETSRVNAENGRVSNETARANAEQARQENEAQRAENETNRASAETARASAEVERARAETSRATAESTRREAEDKRISDEAVRTTNEATRVTSEGARVQSESLREQAEENRQANEERRSDAEKTRIQSEQERTTAETARASAETSRQNAENERVNSEINRATAESERAEAETTRLNNEQSRVNAEKLRVTAETARDTAEQARAEAEAKRDGTINALKDSVDSKITKFYATNSGDTHIVDSDNGKIMDMLVYGKASQIKTTGNNLLKPNLKYADSFDVDFKQGTVLTMISKNSAKNTKGGNLKITLVDGSIHWFGYDKNATKQQTTLTKDAVSAKYLFEYETSENYALYVGDYDKYEPYTGAKPSPSPEYPQDIKSVVNPTMKICGANLLKLDFKKYENNGITLEVVGNKLRFHGTFTDTYTFFEVKDKPLIKKDTKVSLYVYNYNDHDAFAWLELLSNGNIDSLRKTRPTDTLQEDKYLNAIGIEDYNIGDTIDFTTTIAVLDNTTTYKPYKEQTLTLPITLNAVPVTTGGNVTIGGQQYVADYVDVERGKLVRMTKRVNMNDVSPLINLSYGQHSNGIGYLAYSIDEASNETAMKDVEPLSNAYIGSQWINKSGYVYISSVRSIIFVDDRFTDKNTAINLFKDVYIIYVMNTPTEEDLTTEQINALKALKTYYPTTNIKVTSSQLDGYTVFDYPISMANGWNYVKQQLNDTRDYIYDIDVQSAEAYVNSEYATALTELGV